LSTLNILLPSKTARSTIPSYGGLITPTSVTIADTRRAGVTSKAGLKTSTPWGAHAWFPIIVTSSGALSSMEIASPVGVPGSSVVVGAATMKVAPCSLAASATK
jgi:hypothetical protein